MRLLRLAVETRKWDLAAHVLILGMIAARRIENDGKGKRKAGRQAGNRPKQR